MCGIAGLIAAPGAAFDPELLRALGDALAHRGPDGTGYVLWHSHGECVRGAALPYLSGARAGLVARRLAILDPGPAAAQPLASPDGRYHLLFNGEIYNYLELRQELADLGHAFATAGDTEVLLAALVRWGPGALGRLVGMFALALLDAREGTLFLARDPFGIKPLYLAPWRDGLAFASEPPPLLDLPGVSRNANPQRLFDYLRWGVTDHGEETLFAGVRQLPAAHHLTIPLADPRAGCPTRYWQIDLEQRAGLSFAAAAEQLRALFLDSVRLHLRSDLPVGAALSGGIDSAAIVMAARHLEPGRELHTFSFIAEDPTLSEERWADLVAAEAGTVAHKIRLGAADLLADLDRLVAVQGEPFGGAFIFAQGQVFAAAAAAGVKVVLEGQGADELLGGYRHYVGARLASLIGQGRWTQAADFARRAARRQDIGLSPLLRATSALLLPPGAQALALRLAGRPPAPPWLNARWFAERGVSLQPLRHRRGREALRDQLEQTLTKTYLPMLLRYGDRNAMARSLENRVPFLTPALAEFVLGLPEDYVMGGDGTSKRVFRAAMCGLVPEAILQRQDKVGFATPERAWLDALSPWTERALAAAAALPPFASAGLQQEWQAIRVGRRAYDARVWRWLDTALWAGRFRVRFDA